MRAPRRSTGTPRARTKTNRRPTSPTSMGPRPVRKAPDKRPTKLSSASASSSSAAGQAKVQRLKDLMKKNYQAGKARSTGTPKAPTRTTRPTPATPKRGTPPTSSRPRRPSGVSRPGTRRPTNRPPRSVRAGGTRRRFSFRGMGRR